MITTYIARHRRTGRTTELVKWAIENNGVIAVLNRDMARYVMLIAKDLPGGDRITEKNVILHSDLTRSHGSLSLLCNRRPIAIDDVDLFLRTITGNQIGAASLGNFDFQVITGPTRGEPDTPLPGPKIPRGRVPEPEAYQQSDEPTPLRDIRGTRRHSGSFWDNPPKLTRS